MMARITTRGPVLMDNTLYSTEGMNHRGFSKDWESTLIMTDDPRFHYKHSTQLFNQPQITSEFKH